MIEKRAGCTGDKRCRDMCLGGGGRRVREWILVLYPGRGFGDLVGVWCGIY